MHIANNVAMLELSASMMGNVMFIHPTLFWDDAGALLADTGYPGQYAALREAIEETGVAFTRLTSIILTHQDLDHIGTLPDLLREVPHKVEVLSTAEECPYIQGDKRPIRLTPESIEQRMNTLPPDYTEEQRSEFLSRLEHPPTAHVDGAVSDGEVLPFAGGVTVITTPGHTPGHLCLYHQRSKTLIAGDALALVDGACR